MRQTYYLQMAVLHPRVPPDCRFQVVGCQRRQNSEANPLLHFQIGITMTSPQRRPDSSSLAGVLDRILDKGVVIDVWARISIVGLELTPSRPESSLRPSIPSCTTRGKSRSSSRLPPVPSSKTSRNLKSRLGRNRHPNQQPANTRDPRSFFQKPVMDGRRDETRNGARVHPQGRPSRGLRTLSLIATFRNERQQNAERSINSQ